MENECEALPGVAYPGVRDNRSTINTKTGYDDDMILGNYTHTHTHTPKLSSRFIVTFSQRANSDVDNGNITDDYI